MEKWIITGASGSIATACIEVLLKNKINVDAFSRSDLRIQNSAINFTKIADYNDINFDISSCKCILLAQGYFNYAPIENMSIKDINLIIDANFTSQIIILKKLLEQIKDKNKRIDIAILGSTSAYDAGYGTAVYGAAKAGILGLVKALNKEYIESNIRFWLISFGTLANEMGSKVPNQQRNSLLDVDIVAQEIFDKINNKSNMWQPEIVIRRRHIITTN